MKVLGSAFSFLVLSCPCIRGGGLEVEASALGKGEFLISSSSPWAGTPSPKLGGGGGARVVVGHIVRWVGIAVQGLKGTRDRESLR